MASPLLVDYRRCDASANDPTYALIQNRDMPHGLTQGPLRGGYNGQFFDSEKVLFNDGKWHCVEAMFKLNSLDMARDKPNHVGELSDDGGQVDQGAPMKRLLDPCASIECSITPTATASITTTTTTTTTAAVAAPTAAATFLTGLGFVDRQVPAVVVMTVETLDGRLRLGVGPHLHESEPLRAVGVPIDDDLCALDRPEWREQRLKVGLIDVVSQVADIQLLTHDRPPKREFDDPRDAFRVEKKGASVEAHWVDKTREKHRPDREDPAVPLCRQTNRPKDNKKWKVLIENSG
jgi:hypothetical protein